MIEIAAVGTNAKFNNCTFVQNEINIFSNNAQLYIIESSFIDNYGDHSLINVIGSGSLNNNTEADFLCVDKNISALILNHNTFTNNTYMNRIVELTETAGYFQNNVWNNGESCERYCVGITDSNLYILDDENIHDIINFSFIDHISNNPMTNTICISQTNSGNIPYFSFSDKHENNTNYLY